jgi:NADH dehydrogenase [ubiquinone] 1 alpha subcomplex assembly factor 1
MLTLLLTLTMFQSPTVLSDFSKTTEIKNWIVVNDGVMGGKSEGDFDATKDGTVLFKGDVSLKNNGGFTSVRKKFNTKDIKGSTKVLIKLKGDQKKYQFRVKNKSSERHAYKYEFATSGNWEIITIPLDEMIPTFRGMRPNLPNFQAQNLEEIGFLIANKKNETFQLEIGKIWLE